MPVCIRNRTFNTTFNDDVDVPPFTGIFFEVVAVGNRPVEIVTLEVDIIDSLSSDGIAVEVFSVNGSFEKVFDQPEKWELVADSKLVRVPSRANAGLIPVLDFTTRLIPAHGRLSFYITLTSSGLDHNVYALQKVGDKHIQNDDIQFNVGAGTYEYKFPRELERSIYPMFAGVVHYRVDEDCNTGKHVTSSVTMNFLVDLEPDEFRRVLSRVVAKLYSSMLVDTRDLAKPFVSEPTFIASCPPDWRECPNTYYQTKLSWLHDENVLSAGRIRYEMFKPQVMADFDSIMRKKKRNIRSLDFLSSNLSFQLDLVGSIDEISSLQADYFRFVLKHFFVKFCGSSKSIVWDIDLSMQVVHGSNYTVGLIPISATGNILGAAEVTGALLKDTQRCLSVNHPTFIAELAGAGVVHPQFGTEWEVFRTSTLSIVDFKLIEIKPKLTDAARRNKVGSIIITSVGAVLFVIMLGLLIKYMKNRALRYQELTEYREAMKIDRRRRRTIQRSASSIAAD